MEFGSDCEKPGNITQKNQTSSCVCVVILVWFCCMCDYISVFQKKVVACLISMDGQIVQVLLGPNNCNRMTITLKLWKWIH